jgi:hypothetical protein
MNRFVAFTAVLLMLVGLSFFRPSCAKAAGEDEPILTSAFASFHTNDDDKDHDTILTITIEKGRDEFAKVTGITGTFGDHSDHGPFGVTIQGRVSKTDVDGATTTLKIQTNGNDTWRFNYVLELQFSDGSHQTWAWSHQELKENRNILKLEM